MVRNPALFALAKAVFSGVIEQGCVVTQTGIGTYTITFSQQVEHARMVYLFSLVSPATREGAVSPNTGFVSGVGVLTAPSLVAGNAVSVTSFDAQGAASDRAWNFSAHQISDLV